MAGEWDYIVVGAGSSGCVMAERLSASGRHRVLVLEAGGESGFWNRVPKGVAKLVTNPEKIWAYKVTQPRIPEGEASEFWIRGKGVGGSSSVNGMIWSRGEDEDYDAWERDHGATGWNAAAMLGAFKRLEDHADGPTERLGSGGRVHVEPEIFTYPLAEDMIAAGESLQLSRVRELTARPGARVGYYSHNIRKGKRESAAQTFLRPARKRDNVTVVTGARAQRITFDGRRANGIEVAVDGELRHFACAGEVIVCTGAIESPLLLQRSGIGDATLLQERGVAPLVDNPHVGQHLNEHLSLSMPYRLDRGKGTNRHFYGTGAALAMARYLLTGGGIMATGPFEVGAFLNVHEGPQRIAPRGADEPMKVGMIVSNEPGFYEAGWGGVRLENLYVVATDDEMPAQPDGKRWLRLDALTLIPFDTSLIDWEELSNAERLWLGGYHQEVWDTISPMLGDEDRQWLWGKCQVPGISISA